MSLPILQALCSIKAAIYDLFGPEPAITEPGYSIIDPKPFVPVYNPQGATGAILLDEFVDEQEPLYFPTVSPRYHNPTQLALSAPESNAGAIYFSQSPDVRVLTGNSDYIGGNILTNGDFSDGLNEWDESFFAEDYGSARWTSNGETATEGNVYIGRNEPINPPAGFYTLSGNLGGSMTNTGTLLAGLSINGKQVTSEDYAGGSTSLQSYTFYHDGVTPILVSVNVNFTRDPDSGASADITVVVDDVSLKRFIDGSLNVGTPINPGQTHYLHKDDIDINRIYVVAEGGGNYVIANYFYN